MKIGDNNILECKGMYVIIVHVWLHESESYKFQQLIEIRK